MSKVSLVASDSSAQKEPAPKEPVKAQPGQEDARVSAGRRSKVDRGGSGVERSPSQRSRATEPYSPARAVKQKARDGSVAKVDQRAESGSGGGKTEAQSPKRHSPERHRTQHESDPGMAKSDRTSPHPRFVASERSNKPHVEPAAQSEPSLPVSTGKTRCDGPPVKQQKSEKPEKDGPSQDRPPRVGEGTYSGTLIQVKKPDEHADKLAERLNGVSRKRFSSDQKEREFDAISSEYVAQAKKSTVKLGSDFRSQAKATFDAARETGKSVYYHFDGPPRDEIRRKLNEYSQRYGVPLTIDDRPL